MDELHNQLKPLIDSSDIFTCGVDKRRYVAIQNGREWLLQNKNGDGFIVKPWSHPNGETNWKILRFLKFCQIELKLYLETVRKHKNRTKL